MARLRVETGKSQGKSVDVDRQGIIGRGETAQLQINDVKASREHCKVFEQNGSWTVADLNSRNGIKVNGVQTTRKSIVHGDVIEIGETVVRFEMTSAGAKAPGAADTADSPAVRAGPEKAAAPAAAARRAGPDKAVADKKAAAMADARAAAAKDSAAKGAAAKKTAVATKAAKPAAGDGKGIQVSDHVLQFNKVDTKKATLLDIDLGQTAGGQQLLMWIGCVAFLVLLIWLFGMAAGAW